MADSELRCGRGRNRGELQARFQMTFAGWVITTLVVLLFVQLILVLGRRDKQKPQRPHPKPEEGGDSFGDTTHWGGLGKPGGGGF